MAISHKGFVLLPQNIQRPGPTGIIIMGNDIFESQDEIRKRKVMEGLFQVGVVFKHKNSKIIWEIIEVRRSDDKAFTYAIAKSRSSGYRKAIRADRYAYDTFDLLEAPDAVRILYGDKKHVAPIAPEVNRSASPEPETADTAFQETDLSEITEGQD